MTLVGVLVYITVRPAIPARIGGRGASQRFTLLAASRRPSTFALLLFGSHVTATDSALVFPDWPLMGGTLLPAAHRRDRRARPASLGGRRRRRSSSSRSRSPRGGPSATIRRSSGWPSGRPSCSRSRSLVGGAQVLTQLAEWTQTLHLALGAVIWAMLAGARPSPATTRRGSASARSRPGRRRRDRTDGAAGASARPATRSAPTSP